MDRLLQGVDPDTGRPFVLFGKVRIQTLSDGRWRVEDERSGASQEFSDRIEALNAAGVDPEVARTLSIAPEAAIVQVRGLISEVESLALDRAAARMGLTREAAVRRAIAEFVARSLRDEG